MGKKTTEEIRLARIASRAARERLARNGMLWQKGYDDYRPDKTFEETYPKHDDPNYTRQVYYLKCGWSKADREWDEEQRRGRLPICEYCGNKMEEYHSGYYCENQETCKNHTHGK